MKSILHTCCSDEAPQNMLSSRKEIVALKELVLDEMPGAHDLDVTLKVEAKWGYTWGDME